MGKTCAYTENSYIGKDNERWDVASGLDCAVTCDKSTSCVAFLYVFHGWDHSGGLWKVGTGACYYKAGMLKEEMNDNVERACYVKASGSNPKP